MATKHENALQICVDEHFMNWCDAIANGLDSLQHKMQHAYVKQQFEALTIHDPSTGLYNKRGLMEQLHHLHREILSSPQNAWTISNMAASMGMSSTHFQRIYKAEFGISCMEDVITARMEKAKWLLQHTELHVQEIADKCGYHHLNHFMRQFKKRIGVTAMQYRKDTTAQSNL